MSTVFKVVVDGLQSHDHQAAINSAIQRAVVAHLGSLDLGRTHHQPEILSRWRINGLVAIEGVQAIHAGLAESPVPQPAGDHRLGHFEVVLDGIELSDSQKADIESSIQAAVLPHLASLDFGGDQVAAVILKPPQWPGFVASLYDRSVLEHLGEARD